MEIIIVRKFLLAALIFIYADAQATSQEMSDCVPGDVVSMAVTEEMCFDIAQEVERLKDAGMSDDQIITGMTSSKEDAHNWGYVYKRNKTTMRRLGIALGVSGLVLVAAVIGLIVYYVPTGEHGLGGAAGRAARRAARGRQNQNN